MEVHIFSEVLAEVIEFSSGIKGQKTLGLDSQVIV